MDKSYINHGVNKPQKYNFSCLIEREDALLKVQSFFDILTKKDRGILRVAGNYGTGKTRFLSEIAKKASEYGFEAGFISAEQKSNIYIKANGHIVLDSEKVDISNFENYIVTHFEESGQKGFVLIIDNVLSLSDEDLNFVNRFFECKVPVKLGLIYSIEPDSVFSLDFLDIDLHDTVILNPLSPKGVQRWIERSLGWDEAPTSFLKWLYRGTNGFPKHLQKTISYLLKNGFLIYNSDNNWNIVGDFSDLDTDNKNIEQSEIVNTKLAAIHTGSFLDELKLIDGIGKIWNTWQHWNDSLVRLKKIINKQEAVAKLENARLHIWVGRLTNLEGDYEKAAILLNDGLELFRKTTDREGEAEIFYLKALAISTQGDLRKVSVLLQESLTIYRSINDKDGIIRVLQYLGVVYYYQGEYDKAEMYLVESLELSRKIKDGQGTSRTLMKLGMVTKSKGDIAQSIRLFYEYLKKSNELDDKDSISIALLNMGEIAISNKNNTIVQSFYEKSMKQLREAGFRNLIARTLKDLAEIAQYEGDYDKANVLFLESLDVFEEYGDNTEIMWLYRSMGEMELRRGNYSTAKDMYVKGLRVLCDSNQTNWLYVMVAFEALAEISYFQEEDTRAAKLIGAADKLFESSGELIAKDDFSQFQMRHWRIQESMNKESYEAAWNQGNIMAFEEALNFAMDETSASMESDMAERLINYIKTNYSRDISLTDIAEYFNMSTCYLSTMFKHYTGENFKDYLNFYRVKKAKEYMQNGKMKIGTVAKLVGCNSVNTFIRIFKKYEGVSPGQYAQNK